ncbi:hypothetical protein WJX82_007851 [Trebouxia sp. C0006]
MLTVPPGAYPLKGFAYLCSHPNLNARVGGFLAGASALCMTGILALAFFTFRSQLNFVGHSLTMQILQRKLFTMVLHDQGVFAVRPLTDTERPASTSVLVLPMQISTVCAGHA